MELSERQKEILQLLVREYIGHAEPISSESLKNKLGFNISPATIRNELQTLAESGYLAQPHTSAGRVPTNKGYQLFIEITFTDASNEEMPGYIAKEIQAAKQKIDKELVMAQDLVTSLQEISRVLEQPNLYRKEDILNILAILGPSRNTYSRNVNLMEELLRELESF